MNVQSQTGPQEPSLQPQTTSTALPNRRPVKQRKFLYPREVAAYFGVTLSTVRRWVSVGIFNAVLTPGGHSRFPRDEFFLRIGGQKLMGNEIPPVPVIQPQRRAARRRSPTPKAPPAPDPVRSAPVPYSQKIMVVEDNKEILKLVCSLFQNKGYQVAACAHGREALERLEREPFPFILSDISMPVLDGQDFVCAVKQLYRNSKVLMMSAGYTFRLPEFLAYGALGILSKSMELPELYHRVSGLSKERRTTCRLPVRLPLSFNGDQAGTTLNISADGVLFQTDRPLKSEDPLDIRLHGKNGSVFFTAEGSVIRSVPQADGAHTAVYFRENVGSMLGTLVRDGLVRPEASAGTTSPF
jgi:excisionase family DNA binding protein